MTTQKTQLHGPPGGGGGGDDDGPQDPREQIAQARREVEAEEQAAARGEAPEPPDYGPPPVADGDFLPEEEGTQTIMGRKVRKVSHEELMRMHEEETGGPIFENYISPNDRAMAEAQRRAHQAGQMHEEVDQMTPDWMRARRQTAPPPAQPAPPNRDTTQAATPRIDMGGADEAASVLKTLDARAAQAQSEGDLMGAKALRDAIHSIGEAAEMRRKYTPKDAHPVLRKLRSSLGLHKIKPVRQEWAGVVWNCYPANMILDAWFLDNIWEDQRNFSSLKLATYCVGIDDVPLYEVFNVPLEHVYDIQVPEGDTMVSQTVRLKPYRKLCKTCGIEIEIDSKVEECHNCGASVDPFEVPLPLRMVCAEKFYTFLQEEFGPTERLDGLVSKLRDVISDRFVDMDELYPLAKLSVKAPTTDDSLSGEEQ